MHCIFDLLESHPAPFDKLRARYGRRVVYFSGVHDSRESAPMRISFTHIPDPGV